MFACPRCRRGEFRSLAGPGGKAFCPWCGDAVEATVPPPDPGPPLEQFSLEELATRLSGQSGGPAVTVSSASPTPAAPPPPQTGLEARLAESERRRSLVEAELKKELEKKQEIKKAVLSEMGRLEAALAEAQARVRRKDEEHAGALETINVLKQAKQQEWEGAEMRLRTTLDQTELARKELETALDALKNSSSGLQGDLDAARADAAKLRAELAAADAERGELRRKLAAAGLKVQEAREVLTRTKDLQHKLQEARTKAEGLQADLSQRDQRIQELQLLVKTLGDRLNRLADGRP